MKFLALTMFTLFAASTAHAFEKTQFKLLLTRENIRDTAPVAVADGGPLQVRFEFSGNCFVVGRSYDYPCQANFDSYSQVLSVHLSFENFSRLALDELTWTKPEYRAEFMNAVPKDGSLVFGPSSGERGNVVPANLLVMPQVFKTDDGKTEFLPE